MASEVQVYDNFLSETDLNKLEKLLLTPETFPYYFNNGKVLEGDGFVQFTHIFYSDDNVTSDFFVISNKSKTGFTIQFFNSSNTGISRTFDFQAVGHGLKS